jgi:hypothetical protein
LGFRRGNPPVWAFGVVILQFGLSAWESSSLGFRRGNPPVWAFGVGILQFRGRRERIGKLLTMFIPVVYYY